MKLTTDIKPRKDGAVTASTPDGKRYVFAPGKDGALECEVATDAHIAWLLDTGYFFPVDEADIDAGIAAVQAEAPEVLVTKPAAKKAKK